MGLLLARTDSSRTVDENRQERSEQRVASPHPLSRDEADARKSYSYPDPQIAYVAEGRKALHVVGADTQDRVAVRGAAFAFRFTPARPGLWTILVYTSEGRQEPRPGASAVIWMEASKAPR